MEIEQRGDAQLERLRRYAWWLDSGIPVPGTRFRIGLDPIIGLIPGVGDAAGAILAGWIVVSAAGRGASVATLTRMLLNISIDTLVGVIPILGDGFDFAWKSNLRNVALLERHAADPARAKTGDRLFLLLLAIVLMVICGATAIGGVILITRLLKLLG